jgi:chromosome segregation ATPase
MMDENTDAAPDAPAESIEEVRELLFGADRRAADDRVEQLDAKLAQLDARLAQLDAKLAQPDGRIARFDTRLSQVDDRFAQADNQFAQFEKWLEQFDTRLGQGLGALSQEKRAAEARFDQLGAGLEEVRAEMAADRRIAETRQAAAGAVEAKVAELEQSLADVRADMDARLARIEASVDELMRGRGIGAAIGYSLRHFTTYPGSR